MSLSLVPTTSQVKLAQALSDSATALSVASSASSTATAANATATTALSVASTAAPMKTSVIINFGTGDTHRSVTVSLAGVLTSSIVVGSVCWDSTLNRSEEELAIDPIHLSFRAGTDQIIVHASAALRSVVGKFKISMVAI